MYRIAVGTALLAACNGMEDRTGVIPDDMGPMEYDNGDALQCSEGSPTLDEACGYRVVNNATGSEISIADIVYSDIIRYRVLTFSGGGFTDSDGATLSTRRQGANWLVGVNGSEFSNIPTNVLNPG